MITTTRPENNLLLRYDFVHFMTRAFCELNPQTKLLIAPYVELMALKLEDCRKGKTKRLIINLPPRYLKSHCVSIAFTSWWLGHDATANIICASYGQDLAEKLGRDTRNIMQTPWYQELFETRLARDKMAANDFSTTKKGFRMATSVGGVLTGRGAGLIILDDPMKPDEALSETRRTSVNEWYDHSLLSRLNNKEEGCIIIVQQRLHQDDLVGHVLQQQGWEVLSFAAIAEQDEYYQIQSAVGPITFQRRVGEVLHPARESLETLHRMRDSIGQYNFASQYQQNPEPLGGAIIKRDWLRYYELGEKPGTYDRIVQSWDTANKAGEYNGYSVCTTWGCKGKHFFLLHVYRRKMEYPDLKRAVREQAQIYNANYIIIEDKASGTQLIQELRQEGLSGLTPYNPGTYEKVMRLHSQSAAFESGLVLLPKEASWLHDYVHELTTAPGAKHWDQVDSTVQALDWMRKPMPGAGLIEFYRKWANGDYPELD